MSLPRSFYKKNKQINIRHTATPTGALYSPLDLVEKDQPWLAVETDQGEEGLQKKTLIFADHLYRYRDNVLWPQTYLMGQLHYYKQEGFRILVQWPDGSLRDWGGQSLPADYALNWKKFTPDAICQLAWNQHRLPAEDIFLLDYWGITEALELSSQDNVFDWSMLKNDPDFAVDLLSKTLGRRLRFRGSLDDDSLDYFVKLLASSPQRANFMMQFDKLALSLSRPDISFSALDRLLPHLSQLETLMLYSTGMDVSPILERSALFSTSTLKNLSINLAKVSPQALANFLAAASQLEEIELFKVDISGFQEKFKGQLSHVTKLHFQFVTQKEEDFFCLLLATPSLKRLELLDMDERFLNIFKKLPDGQLAHLTHFEAPMTVTNITEQVVELMRVAPSLTSLNVEGIIDWTKLREWKERGNMQRAWPWQSLVFDARAETLIQDLPAINYLFPMLSSLTICQVGDVSMIFGGLLCAGRWSALVELNLYAVNGVVLGNLPFILLNMPYLKKIKISGSDMPNYDLFLLPFMPGSLAQIEEITLPGGPLSRDILRLLLGGAPHLKKLAFFRDCTIVPPLEAQDYQRLQQVQTENLILAAMPSPAASSMPLENSIKIDDSFLDIRSKKDATLVFNEYFPGISPSLYRLGLWRPRLDGLEGMESFKPDDFKPISFPSVDYTRDPSLVCQKGSLKTMAKAGEMIVLPSLDPEEKLFNVQVLDSQGRLVDPKLIQVHYSGSTQFHAITLPQNGEYSIHFQVAYPGIGSSKARPPLPPKIKALVAKYNNYAETDQPFDRKISSLRELSAYVREKQVGACRHRAIAAFEELEQEYKENVRVQFNQVHARLELKEGGRWYPLDLGGYGAVRLLKQEMAIKTPQTVASEEKAIAESKASSPFEMRDISLTQLLSPEFTTPTLVLANSDTSLEKFYKQVGAVYQAQNVFIAHEPAALNFTGFGMTQEGQVKSAYNDFKRWADQQGERAGVICIDARRYSASELARLNDVLEGRIDNQKLPPQWRIIVVDSPYRGRYGTDFRRRVPAKLSLAPVPQDHLLPEQPKDSRELKLTKEIDLYDSPYWQRLVLGSWQIKEIKSDDPSAGFAFQWKKEGLLNLLGSYERIIFKNPPLFDPAFKTFIAELKGLQQLAWADQRNNTFSPAALYQSQGYDWPLLSKNARLEHLSGLEEEAPYVLSDSNILSFIQEPSYGFSPDSDYLQPQKSYLARSKSTGEITVVCAPGLSEGTLAQLLVEAQKTGIRVRLLTPNVALFPDRSPLSKLFRPVPALPGVRLQTPIDFCLTPDPNFCARYFYAQKQALTSSNQGPPVSCFDLSSLDTSELGRTPYLPQDVKKTFLTTGKLSMAAPLSAIAQKLRAGEEVILVGKIPSHLYEVLTSLTLGYIEGKRFKGKLTLIVPPEDKALLQSFTGQNLLPFSPLPQDKSNFLNYCYPDAAKRNLNINFYTSFADVEKAHLKLALYSARARAGVGEAMSDDWSDAARAQEFDDNRVRDTQLCLALSPWVMIEGPTGIGKTHFLQEVLPKKEELIFNLSEWLNKEPQPGKNLTLVMDEVSFLSQLSGEGENFLERFKGLKNKPPSFLWKGKEYLLSEQHKVIFAFNPASYGAGRSTSGFLTDQQLAISFQRLPDYYVRARVIRPILEAALPEEKKPNLDWACEPLSNVYRWIIERSSEDSLITPREIKLMTHIIASQGLSLKLQEPASWEMLASEVAYKIGRQTLLNSPQLLEEFDKSFKPLRRILDRQQVPGAYFPHQHEAYHAFAELMEARRFLLARYKPGESTDLGLGSIALEGGSSIGKTHFVDQLKEDYRAQGVLIYTISAMASYVEKERLLREAFEKGAVVIAHEFNTGLWPNKLLNNFLMGLDEEGKPAKTPGFMLWATQNPPSLAGRSEEDPAIRRRMMKIPVDWPVYQKPQSQPQPQPVTSVTDAGLFSLNQPQPVAPIVDDRSKAKKRKTK